MAISPRKLKTGAQVRGKLTLPDESASKAMTINSSGGVTSSVTTDTELAFLSGVTSSVQTQISANASANTATQTNVSNLITLSGVAANSTNLGTFTGTIIPANSTVKAALQALQTGITTLPSPFYYAGTWAASTNTPTLANGTGTNGATYYVSDSGTVNFGAGPMVFNAGDKVVYNGTTWDKWDMTEDVSSVNGKVGAVVLTTTDIAEGTNLYYTDTRAKTAAVVNSTAGTQTDQAASVSALKSYVAAQGFVKADGSVPFTADQSMGTHKLTNLANPTNPADAVTKSYADALVANAGSPGDLSQASASFTNSQAAGTAVTGFTFAAGSVRSFRAQVSVSVSATTPLYEEFTIDGIQTATDFIISYESTGQDSGVAFDITSAGQVTASSSTYAGFTGGLIKFRAAVTNV